MREISEQVKKLNNFKNIEGKLHKGTIKLGKPYIEAFGDKVRMCASLNQSDNGEQIIYFEVDKEYGQYLTPELSDAFILGIIQLGMRKAFDIEFEQPMSEEMYYRLTTYMIPVYARNLDIFHEIDLIGETSKVNICTVGGGSYRLLCRC